MGTKLLSFGAAANIGLHPASLGHLPLEYNPAGLPELCVQGMMTAPMECHCLRPDELPQTTKLFATFLDDAGRLPDFFPHPPTPEGIARAAAEVKQDGALRRAVVEVLREQNRGFGADGATQRQLDRLAAGAVAIVTGQQVGLFSGPSYSIYKALTTVRVARQMTERGTDAVPVFWLATEDHDLAEINHCFWATHDRLERLEVSGADAAGHHVGQVRLGQGVVEAVRAAVAALEGPAAGETARALEESYRSEETFGSAFGKLMAQLFAGQGIVLLDPLDARLHRLAAPVYRRALEENPELIRDLLARSKQLERAGYHSQVRVVGRSTLLFLNVAGQRVPLRQRNAAFVAGHKDFSARELLETIERAPEAVTANVLLRPVVQDTLLPTAAYVGGPAEVAYLAQAEVVYRRLLGRMPAVVPRASFTLVEPHLARLLKKYGLALRDIFRGRQHLRAGMQRAFLPKSLAARFSSGEKTLRRMLTGLREPLGALDKTLLGALDTADRKMLYQFLHLRGKAAHAENFRTGLLDTHQRQLTDSLYPHHSLQERTLCFLPLLARHGPALLAELSERAALGATQHQVLFL